jgi:hypothetical protein
MAPRRDHQLNWHFTQGETNQPTNMSLLAAYFVLISCFVYLFDRFEMEATRSSSTPVDVHGVP